jgi:hypothetical protein
MILFGVTTLLGWVKGHVGERIEGAERPKKIVRSDKATFHVVGVGHDCDRWTRLNNGEHDQSSTDVFRFYVMLGYRERSISDTSRVVDV